MESKENVQFDGFNIRSQKAGNKIINVGTMKKTAQEIMEEVYEPVPHDCKTLSEDLFLAIKEKPSISKIEECMFRFKDQELSELQAKYDKIKRELESVNNFIGIAQIKDMYKKRHDEQRLVIMGKNFELEELRRKYDKLEEVFENLLRTYMQSQVDTNKDIPAQIDRIIYHWNKQAGLIE